MIEISVPYPKLTLKLSGCKGNPVRGLRVAQGRGKGTCSLDFRDFETPSHQILL
jgi:hypothetical protein